MLYRSGNGSHAGLLVERQVLGHWRPAKTGRHVMPWNASVLPGLGAAAAIDRQAAPATWGHWASLRMHRLLDGWNPLHMTSKRMGAVLLQRGCPLGILNAQRAPASVRCKRLHRLQTLPPDCHLTSKPAKVSPASLPFMAKESPPQTMDVKPPLP